MTRNSLRRPAIANRPFRAAWMASAALALGVCGDASPAGAQAFDPGRSDIADFVAGMSERHGFEPGALATLLSQAESRPSILQAIAKPAEKTLTWPEYRARFLVDRRINRGAAVYAERRTELERAQQATGVPADIVLAIVGVETFFGENTGRFRVVDALATLAFDYPPRAPFFRGELEQFLLMTREEKLDPRSPLGSYAGAMGIPQFMPSSFRRWAVDGDADGARDLWQDWADVFASVGNYLQAHGWEAGQPVMVSAAADGADLAGLEFGKIGLPETVESLRRRGVRFETTLPPATPATLVALPTGSGNEYRVGFANFHAITRYNRSHLYASTVSDLADAIAAARLAPLTGVGAPSRPAAKPAPPTQAVPPAPAVASSSWSSTTATPSSPSPPASPAPAATPESNP
ncbi:MAG: lytic murein transglycosylase B [Steroidobacteraceae bacterium]